MMKRLAAVVLAAGSSSRLGSPKQLVLYQGVPLVARAGRAALQAGANPVVVVLGSNAEAVRAALSGIPVILMVNPEWHRGIGTSVAMGVRTIIEQAPDTDAVLFMVADQPLVGGRALERILDAWSRSGRTIAAAEYGDTIGVPAVFGRAHFEALCSLPPATGAGRLLREASARVRRVAMPEAAVDVDTQEDVHALLTPVTQISEV